MYRNWVELIKPKSVEIVKETPVYGKFNIEPLERGFGTTLGNSLRRVLLSSVRGAAITAVRIEGAHQEAVQHEFQAIPGVVEDVSELILNLKQLSLRMDDEGTHTISLNGKGPKTLTGKNIEHGPEIKVINEDAVIATLSKNAELHMEMVVKKGFGYIPSTKNKDEDAPVDQIAIDSIFTPIRKVNYVVTNARVGQETDYDRLVMEVWTNGAVLPSDALGLAAKVLKEYLQIFINFDETILDQFSKQVDKHDDEIEPVSHPGNDNLYREINELELSVRARNCLTSAGIRLVGDLVQMSEQELLKTKNFGRKSYREIKDLLNDMGLSMGMKLHGWTSTKPVEEEQDEAS